MNFFFSVSRRASNLARREESFFGGQKVQVIHLPAEKRETPGRPGFNASKPFRDFESKRIPSVRDRSILWNHCTLRITAGPGTAARQEPKSFYAQYQFGRAANKWPTTADLFRTFRQPDMPTMAKRPIVQKESRFVRAASLGL